MHRVLVTGHTGYIGSILAPMLRKKGYEVLGMDSGFFADCLLMQSDSAVPSLRRDMRQLQADDLQGVQAVCHLAALSNDPMGELNPELTRDINFRSTLRLAELAKQAGVSRLLFSSSCSIYGKASDAPLDETAALCPLTEYARSKVLTEQKLSELADERFSPVYLRNATAYGVSPRLRVDLVLNNLVGSAVTTGKVTITSDGTPWRPIVHAEDIARAFVAMLEAPREAVHNQAFNIGVQSENYQVFQLGEIVERTVPGCKVEYAGAGNPDPRSYRVDFGKVARMVPQFRPQWNAPLGAQQLYEAYRSAGMTHDLFTGHRFIRLKHLKKLQDEGQIDSALYWTQA